MASATVRLFDRLSLLLRGLFLGFPIFLGCLLTRLLGPVRIFYGAGTLSFSRYRP
jgi:hypothetical protein